jgi:hypothetical protein
MITGQRPFTEDGSPVTMYFSKIRGVNQKPRSLRPDLTEAAEEAILKALAYDPKNRFQHSAEFGEQLARAMSAGKSRTVSLRRRVLLAGIAASVALPGAWKVYEWSGRLARIAPERTLSYSLIVQPYRNGKPFGPAFPAAKEMLFSADYRIRLLFTPSEPGYLYLINEGPPVDGRVTYNVLFPSTVRNGGSAHLQERQQLAIPSEKDFLIFDRMEGEEKLWAVWATAEVPELETVKHWANPQDRGTIKDPHQISSLKTFLALQSDRPAKAHKDGDQTVVHGRGDLWMHLLRLEHR